ncbi:unnamed protein product, partial [Larinioides sclopetarius]
SFFKLFKPLAFFEKIIPWLLHCKVISPKVTSDFRKAGNVILYQKLLCLLEFDYGG